MNILKRVYSLLPFEHKRKVYWLVVLMIIGMILETLGIGIILPAISTILDTQQIRNYLPLAQFSDMEIIIIFIALLVGVFLCKTIFLVFLAWQQSNFSFSTSAKISERLLNIYIRQPFLFHTERNSAELIRNITLEVNMFSQVITALLIIISELFIVIGLISIVIFIEPLLALLAIGSLLIFGLVIERILKLKIESLGNDRQENEFQRLKAIQQGLGGIKTTKILSKEDEFVRRYAEPNRFFAEVGIKIATIQAFPRLWFEFLIIVILSTIILYSTIQGISPNSLIPTLVVFGAAAFRLLPSANRLIASLQSLRFNSVVINTLEKELELQEFIELEHIESEKLKFNSFNKIIISDLAYQYPNQKKFIIDHQSLVIEKGERLGIIGESGSGKTTLLNILLGLLNPTSGMISIDGIDLHANRKAWQTNLGYVPQEVFLDDDSLKRNIAFGIKDRDIDSERIDRCIKQSQLTDFVDSLENGIETIIGERGSKISGGQKQRIGLARALYHSPKVLVLDEATSSLDSNTENEVMRSVYSLDKELTIVIVAHRLSTLEGVDNIVLLEKGKLITKKQDTE